MRTHLGCLLLSVGAIGTSGCAVGSAATTTATDQQAETDDTAAPADKINAPNDEGVARTVNTSGKTNLNSKFFQDFGTNLRTCGTCHDPQSGWSMSSDSIDARFDATDGTDPVFRPVDGANSPNADVSTVDARRAAYSMLLAHGVIRVGRPIPAGAEFTLSAVDDPYGFASASELSLFRRPLPTMNLEFLTVVMWDGRETINPDDLDGNLAHQANDATLGHAQAAQPLTAKQQAAIVAFEEPLYTAQQVSDDAGKLDGAGANGGPAYLSTVDFYPGIERPTHTFQLFDAWANIKGTDNQQLARVSVARGQVLFNTRKFNITGTGGLPDQVGTCATCHNTPDVGGHSSPLFINEGLADASRRADMPLYTLTNNKTGATVQTSDPGLALSTGKWADIGAFKVPNLRAVESRSPYFHNGQITSIEDLVSFYNTRFAIGLSAQEAADLAAFVKVL